MSLTNAERQKRYRAKHAKMTAALKRVVAKLERSTKPDAVEIVELCREALKGIKP